MTLRARRNPVRPDRAIDLSPQRELWPWIGVAAGITGTIATIVTDLHIGPDDRSASAAMIDQIPQFNAHAGVVTGYITIALLLVLAANWKGAVESRVSQSVAARVVTYGLVSAGGSLMLGYGWKGALAIYLPNGITPGGFDTTGLYIYYMLNDFGAYIGWLGVTIAAGAIAWMGLRERVIPLWVGIVSCLPVLGVAAATGITGLPGFPGVVSQVWMIVAFAGLGLSRTVVREPHDAPAMRAEPIAPITRGIA